MDRVLSNLDSTNVIKKSMPKIIDAFVMVYGEENRDLITEKLNNIMVVGYYDTDALFSLLYDEEHLLTDDIVKEVFKKHGIEYNDENIDRYFGKTNTFKLPNLIPILSAYKYVELMRTDPNELMKKELKDKYENLLKYIPDLTYEDFFNHNLSEEQIKKLPNYYRQNLDKYLNPDVENVIATQRKNSMDYLIQVHPGLTEANADDLIRRGELDYLVDLGKSFQEGLEKYNSFVEQNLQVYIDLHERLMQYEKELSNKYYLDFLMEFKDYLNEKDTAILEEMISKKNFDPSKLDARNYVFSCLLSGQLRIDYFDEKSDKQLANPGTSDYRKDVIKKNRVNYFKYRGIDLGDNYDDYVNDPRCLEIWPKYEEVAKIAERRDYHLNEYNIELCTNNEFYEYANNEAKKRGLLDKESLLTPDILTHRTTCVCPNIIYEDGEYKESPMVFVYTDGGEYADARLIHELNHVIELALIEVKGNDYSCISGWDLVNGNINQDNPQFANTVHKREEKRGYELFSEIINELLAQKISSNMHENGVFILNDKDHYKDHGGTSYERTLFIVREFFETYLDDIIASRRGNNIEIIWNKVGKKNFDAMNELFHEFDEAFPEFTFYRLIDDFKDNKDTELVRKFNGIKAKRDKILLAMKEYSLSRQVNL